MISYGQTYKFPTSEESVILNGNQIAMAGSLPLAPITVRCKDWGFFSSPSFSDWRQHHKYKSCTNNVVFKVNEMDMHSSHSALVEYTYRLTYRLVGFTNPDDTVSAAFQVVNEDTLTISYNSSSSNQPYQNINLKKYSGFYKMVLTVNQIYKDDGVGGLIIADFTDPLYRNFEIEGQIVTQVYDKDQYGSGGTATPPVVSVVPNIAARYLDVSWLLSSSPVSPIGYELEWAFADDYNVSLPAGTLSPMPMASLQYNFKKNGTRVWLDTNNYRIPLTYPRGYVVYRVRPVRPDSLLFKYPVYGDWSCSMADNDDIGGAYWGCGLSGVYYLADAYMHDSLNWQYTISFSEGGRFKHVGSFFDGLLKNRQSITRFNSDLNKLIVTNNIYDYEGRSSIQTWPAPTLSPSFSYLHNVDLNSLTTQPYKAQDFDSGLAVCSNLLIPPLASSALASHYYSPLNLDPDSLVHPWQKYVPDAEGYPFIQTVYEPGYADRVKAQGGAGPTLQVGDSNYLANYYVGPGQKKLNSLFGPNIGWSSFYNMTVSRDANKQLSMSIKDYEGHMVASALIGQGPDSSDHAIITDNLPASQRFNRDLLLPATPNQAIDTTNGTRIADADYFNEAQGDDSLLYDYSLIPYPVCASQNIAVKAHLRSYISDKCGNLLFDHVTDFGDNGMVAAAPINYSVVAGSFSADIAPYHVQKKLSYYPSDISDAVDSFMKYGNCFRTKEDFIRSSVTGTNFPCTGVNNTDSTPCTKMKWDMMQQLFPGAVYGQYYYKGSKLKGTDNSIFSPINCLNDSMHVTMYHQHIDTVGYCIQPFGCANVHEWGTGFDGLTYNDHDPGDGIGSTLIGTIECGTLSSTLTPSATLTPSVTLTLEYSLRNPTVLERDFGACSVGSGTETVSGHLQVMHSSADIRLEDGYIHSLAAPYPVIGEIHSNSLYTGAWGTHGTSTITMNSVPITGNDMHFAWQGTLPHGQVINILTSLSTTVDYTYTTDTTYIPYTFSYATGFIDSNTCKYRYQDTCLVTSLKDTITVGGIFYNHLRTMSGDSFRMVYNAAITEGNYSIAEALLPLHPQYCELQNCFVDSFKKQMAAVPNWRAAQSMGLLKLEDLVAHDPLIPIMAASGMFPHPSDTLSTFGGGLIRLDTFVLINTYCAASDSVMFNQCATSMFRYEISHHLLVNDMVKDFYFKNLSNLYFAYRQNIINKLFFRGGTSCAHCADVRLDLDTATAVPPVPFGTDYTHPIDSSFVGPHSGWFAHIATLDTGDMHDSAIVFNYYIDTMMAHRSMDTIIAHLSNCIIGNTSIKTGIRNKLENIYSSGAAPMGNFTAEQILLAIRVGGATMNDLCNPYVITAGQFGNTSPSTVHDCNTAGYYRSIDSFLNNNTVKGLLQIPGVGTITLDPAHHHFHSLIATALGNNTACTLRSSLNLIRQLYEIDATTSAASGAGDTVKIFLHCPGNAYFFSGVGPFNITTSCINSNSALSSAAGLVNEYSFVADITRGGPAPDTCTMYGWVDSINTMGYSDNALAECIPCTQMKMLYKQFADTMARYGVNGADHPLYGTILANFMNGKLVKHFAADDYERFIQSCALADSLKMPVYGAGYANFTFTGALGMNGFITSLNSLNPSYDFSNSFRDSVSGALRIAVDLNNVPVPDLWRYKAFLNTYGASNVNQLFILSAPSSGTEAGFIYSDPAIAFSPADSNIIDTTYVKFRSIASRGIWQGDHFVPKKVYNVVAVSGAPAYAISRSISKLEAYFAEHYTAGAVFTACYQHTVDGDYYKSQKQALLAYTYSLQQLPPYQVLDSLRPANLIARIPSYTSYTAGYAANATDGATYTNLYLSNAGMSNRLYDTLQRIITLASSSAGYGYIFPTALVTPAYSMGAMDLDVYRNADHTYWYRYFSTGDSLFNVYISLPSYIPIALHPLYHVVSIAPAPGDSLNRCFTVGIRKGTDPTVLYATGRADFVISKSVQLDKILLGNFADSIANPADTFNNCERGNLLGAVSAGVFNYNNYRDSIKRAVRGNLTAYLARNTKEKLILSYMDHEFNLTLYGYDRAGNLVSTVPPAGSQPIAPVGTLLDDVDTARMNNTPAVSPAPVYNKINTYNYNSYDLVQQQNTIDGGKTRFFYDNAGRLVFSQNAKQAPDGYYTYNIYDQQNRLIETGESQLGCAYFDPHIIPLSGGGSSVPYCHYTYTTTVPAGGGMTMLAYLASPDPYLIYNINLVSYDTIAKFIRTRNRRDVVMTFYDTVAKKLETISGLDEQSNLRKRVTCVKYFESLTSLDKAYYNYSYATHYSYDMEGNVNMLVQDFPDLAAVKQQYKRVDYDYDVISGKVNMLSYNSMVRWPE
ncbi:hypothetical protein CJD36_010990 [Flavipsychrobacter stenotrophus]|uniref:Uncharacterized protein n=2 Tax=Flavipsychrobacter stenotrophus TaxID=2077091 RepID=A0A2S7SUS6_9BACT|nr:hypothetical protein CJD36_010990 [Flavipsychrobacter stenotrophus]